MRNAFLFILTVASILTMNAQNRTEAKLHSLAVAELQRQTTRAKGMSVQSVSAASVVKLDDGDNYSIYGNNNSFVVLSNNSTYRPVLGVSFTPYRKGNMPCGFNWWINEISKQLAAPTSYKAYTRAVTSVIDTMITTKWGQGTPYNDYTPKVNKQHAPTGCIATAMAQIMNYYEYPAQGKGKATYSYGNKSRTSNITTTYNWSRMLDTYNSRSNVQNKIAVGYLMRDCGYASSMNYDTDGSGAYDNYAALAFGRNFSYDSLAVRLYNRMFYTDDQWMQIIQTELLYHRPILYTGIDRSYGGHAFVFDGMDSQGRVHVNWGWDGSANGYYTIDMLHPSGYYFDYSQAMIVGLRAQATPDAGETLTSQWVSTGEFKVTTTGKNNITFSVDNMFNIDYRDFDGTVGLVIVNQATNDSTMVSLIDTENDSTGTIPYGSGYNLTDTAGVAIPIPIDWDDGELSAGTYRVFLASVAYGEPLATPFLYYGGEEYPFTFTVASDGTVSGLEVVSGIGTILKKATTVDDNAIYSIDGRRVVNGNLPPGIYIHNGKKYVKK